MNHDVFYNGISDILGVAAVIVFLHIKDYLKWFKQSDMISNIL